MRCNEARRRDARRAVPTFLCPQSGRLQRWGLASILLNIIPKSMDLTTQPASMEKVMREGSGSISSWCSVSELFADVSYCEVLSSAAAAWVFVVSIS